MPPIHSLADLRLVLNKQEASWAAGKEESDLLLVPAEDDVTLIYGERGVYAGQRLGTPCGEL